jgi:hypothetical protein
MIKNMKKVIVIFSFLIFTLAGCSDFLDVNENPNYPAEVEDYLILHASQASVASVMSADYGLVGSFWSQHWTQNNTSSQYKTFETYTLGSNDARVDGSYLEMYVGGLGDNEILHLKAEAEENWGLYLMTSTIKAYGFQYLVDFYGNVPYDEAFKGESEDIFNPKINSGEEVYNSIYELLNVALSKDLSDFNADRYASADLLLGANINDWVAFANTLKLRIILRQAYAKSAWVNTELASLLASGTFLTTDVALRNFEDVDSKSNPLYEADQRQLNTSNNIRANATFTTYLKANGDPRLDVLFAEIAGNRYGMITGSYEVPNEVWLAPDFISKPILTATMPVYLMTVAESELLQAEAYFRLGDLVNAKLHYDAGVNASFDRMGVNAAGFLGVGEPYAFNEAHLGLDATDTPDPLRDIIMAKWVDAADGQRGMESFIDKVRTGYPKACTAAVQNEMVRGYEADLPASYIPGTLIYSIKGATGGKFPVRLPYADSEINYNSNAAVYKGLADGEVMQTKVWWNK